MPRQRKASNRYFTKEHEEAIIQYARTTDNKIRTQLYVDFIGPVFDEMVDKIVYTYKFTTLPNIDSLKEDCKIWLTTILDKFDPDKKSKAFSYFSVITKNWFIHKVKRNARQFKKEVYLEDVSPILEAEHLATENQYLLYKEKQEFFDGFWLELNNWDSAKLKDNEKKVLEAIKLLFSRAEEIEIFNKKAIYLYIREITGLNTKQVVNNLNKLKIKYRNFKKKWNEAET
jgi:hypothetical protein